LTVRVLTLVDNLYRTGGGERIAVDVTLRLDRTRFQPTLVSTHSHADFPMATELAAAGIRVLQLPRQSRWSVAVWRPLLAELRATDVLHSHMFGANVWASILGPIARVPAIVCHEHSWSYQGQPLRRILDRALIARSSDAFVAVSQADAQKMREVERVAAKKIRCIPNGVVSPVSPDGANVRAELSIPAGSPLILAVGGLRPVKAYEVLIEAAALLRHEFPELRVLIAGGGRESVPLTEQIGRLGLANCVTLLGERHDVPNLLAAADVCVSSSDREGSPLSIMEFMAFGKPVVATNVGGVPELLEDGVHGYLVPRRDAPAMASRVAELLRSPSLREVMGRRGQERQRAEFDIGVMVGRIEDLYLELLDGVT
jgi:glycosyltransferase involved in cell wall biosynthesis